MVWHFQHELIASSFNAPALKDVEGVTALSSSQDLTNTCNQFNTYFTNGILKKKPVCAGKAVVVGTTTVTRSATVTTTAAARTGTSVAGSVEVSAGMVGVVGVAAAFALL